MHRMKGITNGANSGGWLRRVSQSLLLTACCLFLATLCLAQQSPPSPPGNLPPAQAPQSQGGEQEEAGIFKDWAGELLDGILSSDNSEAADSLFRAAFSAGRGIIPQLAEAKG